MLVEFSIRNFRSINAEQTVSLVAGTKDPSHPECLIPQAGYNLLKIAALYGANAAGKSNLTKAIEFVRWFVTKSATDLNESDSIRGVSSFRLSEQTLGEPSSFAVHFLADDTRFIYRFSTTKQCVYEESLTAGRPSGRSSVWLDRRRDDSTGKYDWTCRGPLKPFKDVLQARTRANALALSVGARENITPLQSPYNWFRTKLWVIDLSDDPRKLVTDTIRRCETSQGLRERLLQLVCDADLGIQALTFANREMPDFEPRDSDDDALRSLKGVISNLMKLTSPDGNPVVPGPVIYDVNTVHRSAESGEDVWFDFEDESNGTRRLVGVAGPVLDALEHGAVLVLDELDCSMHPLITRKLVELFQSATANRSGAQMVLTTHDSSLMDRSLFRRDQIWLVEKGPSGASEFYSLHDLPERPRATEAFERNYLGGRYGGVPILGRTFEDLVLS